MPAWTDRVLWRRRHPRSKHVTTLASTDELLVDVTDGDTWMEYSSDSEDEEDGSGPMEVDKPPGRNTFNFTVQLEYCIDRRHSKLDRVLLLPKMKQELMNFRNRSIEPQEPNITRTSGRFFSSNYEFNGYCFNLY